MKIDLLKLCGLVLCLIQVPAFVRAELPFKPLESAPGNAAEEQELKELFAVAQAGLAGVPPGPEGGAQRRGIALALDGALEDFVATHTNSAWSPVIRLWLARGAELRAGYLRAMDHYVAAWPAIRAAQSGSARGLKAGCSGSLARLLALTGRMEALDALAAETRTLFRGRLPGSQWNWAMEMRRWYARHPEESFKCGVYCLDALGRTTQLGQFHSKQITETASSTNGYTAADLVRIGGNAGIRLHAAILEDVSQWPVPCVVHLRSEHFVVVRERRGDFYGVSDPLVPGTLWLVAEELAQEATGCVLVSDAVPPAPTFRLTRLDATAAQAYRGRCHGPLPSDHNDNPCFDDCKCRPGSGGGKGGGGSSSGEPGAGNGQGKGGNGGDCATGLCGTGMPTWFVSEPYLNLWLYDEPLRYTPALGPPVSLALAYSPNRWMSLLTSYWWHGALLGNTDGHLGWSDEGRWSCSWLSFVEMNVNATRADVMLPNRNWATFDFPSGSSLSEMNYQLNIQLEKVSDANGVSALIMHAADGATTTYGVLDTNIPAYYVRCFYMSAQSDPTGKATTFTYNPDFLLTNVAAADGTSFTLHYTNTTYPKHITSVTSSYGATVTFTYGGQSVPEHVLTAITDAAGITSRFTNDAEALVITDLATPYGTTSFGMSSTPDPYGDYPIERWVIITNANGTQEFYALMNEYGTNDWPDFATSQIPTNTPVNTLDTTDRSERNTFYWNAQQRAPYIGTALADLRWAALKKARIRHWLATDYPVYTHFDSLSLEQMPSPDGTTEGQITWYDYAGKESGINYEVGTQVQPAVIARVMPDGTTAYQYFERLTNGLATKVVDKWAVGNTAYFRTNYYLYAANNTDLIAWTNAAGVRAATNIYNAYHQVLTNYDALNQETTYTYDGTTRQLLTATRPSGLVTSNYYDGTGRLRATTDLPIARTESFTWRADGNLDSVTDARGLTLTNFWDGLNRLTGVRHPDGTTTSNVFTIGTAYPNGSGGLTLLDVTGTKDRLDHWTYFGYDSLRRKVAETNANSVITRYGYCDCGATASVTNAWAKPEQFVTWFEFDQQGRRIYTHYPDATVTNWFDSLGRTITTCDAWGCRWFGYDNLSPLTSITNAFGAEQLNSYDVEDQPTSTMDANGVTVTSTYDDVGRLRTRTYPDSGAEAFGYSARGMIAFTNQLGMTNYYVYDEAGRKLFETNANWELICYTNNAAGDLLALVDGKNQVTKWNYDEYGRVTNKLDQLGTVILKYTYDADSRLSNRWSVAKGTTIYSYDAVGNLTTVNYPASTDVTFAYDALNRLTNMVDAAGTTAYAYTAGGQLGTEDGPWASDTVTNFYFNRLRTNLSLAQPTGQWTNLFSYDAAKRLTNVTSPAGAFAYTLGGASAASPLIKKLALPNTSYITNAYDNVARLRFTKLNNSSHTTLNSHEYSYNPGNQRTQQVFTAGSTYAYDAAWNLNYRTNNTTLQTFKVDSKNQLTNAPGVGTQSYDGNGNLIQGHAAGPDYFYTYDDENQLTAVEREEVWRAEFIYDGRGRLRVRKEFDFTDDWTLTSETHYVYDGMRVIQERDGSNVPTVSYTRGTDLSGGLEGAGGIGGLLARSHGYSSGNWSTHNFYHADGNGNITYLANSSQALAASYRYDPYGNTLSSSGTLASANVYRFSSKEVHTASGLYYYGYRWYSPSMQRWVNRDPLGEAGGINLYEFVENDSINWIDPYGLSIQDPSGPPPVPVPGDPNAKWIRKGTSGTRPKWVPDRKIPGRSPPSASWERTGSEGHWDIDHGVTGPNGKGIRTHHDLRGKLIPENEQHNRNYRRPKSGPGARCVAIGAGAVLAGTAATAGTAGQMAENGAFERIGNAARNGDNVDDAVYDEALEASLQSGAGMLGLNGVYGAWKLAGYTSPKKKDKK